MRIRNQLVTLFVLAGFVLPSFAANYPLPSWNNTVPKKAIIHFVRSVSNKNSSHFVEPENRIAVFDNDGTLWVEKPIYTQIAFVVDRVKQLAPKHPEWKKEQPFKAALDGDMGKVAASGMEGLQKLLVATHSGMTSIEFKKAVNEWINSAKHPKFKRRYTELVYQPQMELLNYLRDNDFKIYIVSGGGVAFLRAWSKGVYGIPVEQVIGSSVVTKFANKDGKPVIIRAPKIEFINDKAGKPVAINKHIGKRPIFAFGNSDGDIEMIQYTKAGDGLRLGLILQHTDAAREYAYDRNSHVGKLDRALDLAKKNGWIIVDMKRDWKRVFH